jgi:hypothetical protein
LTIRMTPPWKIINHLIRRLTDMYPLKIKKLIRMMSKVILTSAWIGRTPNFLATILLRLLLINSIMNLPLGGTVHLPLMRVCWRLGALFQRQRDGNPPLLLPRLGSSVLPAHSLFWMILTTPLFLQTCNANHVVSNMHSLALWLATLNIQRVYDTASNTCHMSSFSHLSTWLLMWAILSSHLRNTDRHQRLNYPSSKWLLTRPSVSLVKTDLVTVPRVHRTIARVFHSGNHYAIAEVDHCNSRTITIYDGLFYDLSVWLAEECCSTALEV